MVINIMTWVYGVFPEFCSYLDLAVSVDPDQIVYHAVNGENWCIQ